MFTFALAFSEWGEKGPSPMTDRLEKTSAQPQTKLDASPKQKASPRRRPSYDRVIENIDKWVNSSGLQKPS